MASKPKQNSKNTDRDLVQTPGLAVEAVLPFLDAFKDRLYGPEAPRKRLVIWESAAGEGLLVGYLKELGFTVHGTDILTGRDRFKYRMPFGYDLEMTNIPFSLKYEWLKQAYKDGSPFLFYAPSDMFFNVTSATMFEQHGMEMISPYERIDYKMPVLGWGNAEKASQAQFHSSIFTWQMHIGQPVTRVHLLKGAARTKALGRGDKVPLPNSPYSRKMKA